VPSDPLPEGIDYPLHRAVGRGHWTTSRDICKKVSHYKDRVNLFSIPLKNLEVQIKILEATDSFGYYQRFIF
jgi:hypothetical protein